MREKRKCKECGNEKIGEEDNFCEKCGEKLQKECNCWIKKGRYDCGERTCPGYGLYRLEKLKTT